MHWYNGQLDCVHWYNGQLDCVHWYNGQLECVHWYNGRLDCVHWYNGQLDCVHWYVYIGILVSGNVCCSMAVRLSMRCLLNLMIPTRASRSLSRDCSMTYSTGKQTCPNALIMLLSSLFASDKPVGTKKLTKAFG